MWLLVEGIVRLVLRYGARKEIESIGKVAGNQVVRLILLISCLAIAVVIAVSSAFLWTTERLPQVHGLFQYVGAGGPVWVIATPLCAALLAVLLAVPVAGRFTIGMVLGAGIFGLTLASAGNFQGTGNSGTNAAVGLSAGTLALLMSALLMSVMLVLALTDLPPVDSALAPLTMLYWGRLGHLRALSQFGMQRGWEVSGPAGWTSTLTVAGPYDPAHRVTVTSSLNISISDRASSSYVYSVKMESPADIVAFRISYQPLPKSELSQVAYGESRMPGKPTIYYFLTPRPEEARGITQSFMSRLAYAVEAGRPYLRSRLDFVHATPVGMCHTHSASYRLTARDADLEPMLRWMRELCDLLEEVCLRPQVSAPAGSDGSQGHGVWGAGSGGNYWNGGM